MRFTNTLRHFNRSALFIGASVWSYLAWATSALATPPYTGIDQYTLSPPIPNAGGGMFISTGGGNHFASGGQVTTQANGTATLWLATTGTAVDLTPTSLGHSTAVIASTNGTFQVGNSEGKALLWNGTADSAIDLGFGAAVGVSPNGVQQVGDGGNVAVLWNGTASSAVDLNPTNYLRSIAYGTNGTKQVGWGYDNTFIVQAFMWSGTASSAVNLNPTNLSGLSGSIAEGISPDGTQQVGVGLIHLNNTETSHAVVWSSTANSAVDLNPTNLSGFSVTTSIGTNGSIQVGWGYGSGTDGYDHALLWSGAADSAVDLNAMLPFAATSSWADSIDLQGNIFGTAVDSLGNIHAVEWQPVPEPSTLVLCTLAFFGLTVPRRPSLWHPN